MWTKLDDGAWSSTKLRRVGRSARGLFWDVVSFCGDKRTDGFVDAVSLPQIETSTTDPDLKALHRAGLVHRTGDACRCIDRRGFEWPRERGYLVHDFLDYNPSREENDVAKAQRAELRDPALRARVRARDFGRCRYCAQVTNPKDKRGDAGETLDHVDPALAAGEENLVLACRACNSGKKRRTPEQALMVLLDVADVRAKHYAELGVPDPDLLPDLAHDSSPTQVGQADGPGRVGVGSGPAVQVGPATTVRDSEIPNPYLRAGHGDPSLEDPPPQPQTHDPPARPAPRSRQPRKRKRARR